MDRSGPRPARTWQGMTLVRTRMYAMCVRSARAIGEESLVPSPEAFKQMSMLDACGVVAAIERRAAARADAGLLIGG